MSNTRLDVLLDLLLPYGLLGCHKCALLLPGREFLARDALGRTLTCPCISVSTLTSNRQIAAMPQTPVTTDVHKNLDVLVGVERKKSIVVSLEPVLRNLNIPIKRLAFP